MVKPLSDRLYNLLPAVYRSRDAEPEQAQALRALMALLEEQLLAVEADVDQLYDDWFIETCQEWLVPYIGELLAVRPLQPINPQVATQRAYVANTLSYRQRKGTAAVLEQLSRDVTNWPTRAVEFFERLTATQNLNHVRLHNLRTPDLRTANALELVGGPFETQNHLPEVRRIENGRGRYNITHVGLYLWRLQSYPLAQVQACPVSDSTTPTEAGLYWINPLGQDAPLFNTPNPETTIAQFAAEANVPSPLRRRALYDEVEAIAAEQSTPTPYFDRTPPFQVWFLEEIDGEPTLRAVPPEALCIADLSGESGNGWQRLPATRPNLEPLSPPSPLLDYQVAIDPVLGRLALPTGAPSPLDIRVSHAYGFSGDIGSGPYDRRDFLDSDFLQRVDWQVGVSRDIGTPEGPIFAELTDAIAAWNTRPAQQQHGIIALMDNLSYATGTIDTAPLKIRESSELLIVAADWPERIDPVTTARERLLGQLNPTGRRVHLCGDLVAIGTAPPESRTPGRLMLNGLLIEGQLSVLAQNPDDSKKVYLGRLELDHTTLVPSLGGLWVAPPLAPAEKESETETPAATEPESKTETPETPAATSFAKPTPIPQLEIFIRDSITGPLAISDTVTRLEIADSILDATASDHLLLSAPITFPETGIDGAVQVTNGNSTAAIEIAATSDQLRERLELPPEAPIPQAQKIAFVREQFETALQAEISTARVMLFGDCFIIAGEIGQPLSFAATGTDSDTVTQLGLAAANPEPLALIGPSTRVERSTLLGRIHVTVLEYGSECIFDWPVEAQRRQQGCVRFSYVAPGSAVPRRYRCQPDLAIARAVEQIRQDQGDAAAITQEPGIRDRLQRQLVPVFTSLIYGNPAYGQLSRRCPEEIRIGAEDGSEMGAFSFLKQPQREANLRVVLDEYLRFGLAAGLFFVT